MTAERFPKLKGRVLRIRRSQNAKIVDVTWFYLDDDGAEAVVLNDSFGVAPDADDDQVRKAIADRLPKILPEVAPLIPDTAKNQALIGQEVGAE